MDHKDLCNHTRIKLIASAIGHQQCTKTAANIIPLPGTDRVIAIGTPAEVCGLLADAPLTAPAPLTTPETDMLELAHLFDDARESGKPLTLSAESCAALHAAMTTRPAAPAPQQSESISTTEFQALAGTWCGASQSCDQWTRTEGARQAWAALVAHIDNHHAKAAPAAPVQRIPDILTVETIQGAIAFGRMGINPPPSPDHWGNEFWQIGRQLAKLSETSAWDNVTPVDVAAPVQANLQSIADELEDAAAPYGGDFADTVNACVEALRDLVAPTSTEEMVRFCPHCASIGEIGKEYRDCCPDGSAARHIPRKVAEVCRDTFKLAIGSVAAPVQAEQAQAEPVPQSVLDTLWQRVTDAREAAYTFGDTCKEAVEIALDGVLDMLVQADLALPAQAEQAAAVRAAALEEAALAAEKVADDFCERQGGKWPDLRDDAETGARSCVDEIRALAAPSTATSNDTGALGDAGGAK